MTASPQTTGGRARCAECGLEQTYATLRQRGELVAGLVLPRFVCADEVGCKRRVLRQRHVEGWR
jgi:hypothetical protein